MTKLFYVGIVDQATAARNCLARGGYPALKVRETTDERLTIEGSDEEVRFALRSLAVVGYNHTCWSKSFRGEAITEVEYQALCL